MLVGLFLKSSFTEVANMKRTIVTKLPVGQIVEIKMQADGGATK